MINRLFLVIFIAVFCISGTSFAGQISQVADRGTLGNVGFKELALNDNGDYLAVSRTKVFVGQIGGPLQELPVPDNLGFSITRIDYTTGTTDRISVDMEVIGQRAAINSRGDFILTSNTKIFIGNVRDAEIREVLAAERGTEFQSVAINDAGHYVAASYSRVYGGMVSGDAPLVLVDDTAGNMSTLDLWASLNVDAWAGESHLKLNANGDFVAASSRGVYGGNVGDGRAETLLEDRDLGTIHVALNQSGDFIVVGYSGIFSGSVTE